MSKHISGKHWSFSVFVLNPNFLPVFGTGILGGKMLDKLIISKNGDHGNTKFRNLLVSTTVLVTSFLMFALVFSLFSQNFAMGQDDLNITTLIAPPSIPKSVPPKPEPIKDKQEKTEKNVPKIITRKFNIQRMEEPPVKIPDKISTRPSKFRERPKNGDYLVGKPDAGNDQLPRISRTKRCTENCVDIKDIGAKTSVKTKVEKTPIPIPKPPLIKKRTQKPKSGGVLNGEATYLAQPPYPSAAIAVRASGRVVVEVIINEQGRVIFARAKSGHQRLRNVAVKAARKSKFSPTTLSKNPVKVKGLIVYNFKRQ